MLLKVRSGGILLIIALWLAVKLVEHVGDLNRSKRHVSIFAEGESNRDLKIYEDSPALYWCSSGLLQQSCPTRELWKRIGEAGLNLQLMATSSKYSQTQLP